MSEIPAAVQRPGGSAGKSMWPSSTAIWLRLAAAPTFAVMALLEVFEMVSACDEHYIGWSSCRDRFAAYLAARRTRGEKG